MEVRFLESLQAMHCGFLDVLMLGFTYLGELGAIGIITALFLLVFKKTRRGGLILAAALAADVLIVNIFLKNVIARPRPFTYSDKLKDYILGLNYKLPDDWSFPSGHSAVAFCTAAVLVRVYGVKALPAFIVAVLIAFSRLYIGVHYPTDVLGGAAIGGLIGYVTAEIGVRIKLKKKE